MEKPRVSTHKARRDLRYVMSLGQAARRPRYWPSFLLLGLFRLLAFLPLPVLRTLGAGLGALMRLSNAKRRRIVEVNLGLCFPDQSPQRRQWLLRRHFRCLGQSFVDLAFLAWAGRRRVMRHTRIHGLRHFRDNLARGRRIILLAPHCVGMNYGGSVLSQEHPIFSMAKAQKDPVLNWILERARTRFGGAPFLRDKGLRPVIKGIQAGTPFYYLPDEDFGPRGAVFAPFFGVPRATLTMTARLAALTDAAVIPCFTRLLPRGRGYEIRLAPPLAHYPTGDENEDARRVNAAIEQGLEDMPEQYMWTLRIFRTRPPGEPPVYD